MRFKNVRELIRKRRVKKGLTQKQLAALVNMGSHQGIANVEHGTCNFPLKKAVFLCDALGIKESVLKRAYVDDYKSDVDTALKARVL